jgi:signal transduction histidine kinase
MDTLHEFFSLNRPLVLFVYGQTFFIMGLAIFLQSRRHSRLRLSHDLRWLAAFGILHGIYEWGDVFIPYQADYLPRPYTELLLTAHVVLLAVSFLCLLIFGAVTVDGRWRRAHWLVIVLGLIWGLSFWVMLYSIGSFDEWHRTVSIWARYLLGLPGGLLAAYGLRYQAETHVAPLGVSNIYHTLRIAGVALLAYAFVGGVVVSPGSFFPANVLNKAAVESLVGVPIEVFRSIAGLILAISMIRALEIFDIEVDRLIEGMEVENIQANERDRIGQEIHDGAIQAVYSASLILESMQDYVAPDTPARARLETTERVLSSAISDLRRYMVSLRSDVPQESLASGLRQLVSDPRFSSLLRIQLNTAVEPDLKPIQVGHILAIVQEALSNIVRHAHARNVQIEISHEETGLVVKMSDDGQGFDEKSHTPGYGLRAMRDRARLLGAALTIHSRPGKGTTISLSIPEESAVELTSSTPG